MFSLEEKRTPLLLAYDLQLFANDEGGEKTEEPTAKKIEDSRKEGQVAKSKELTSAAMLLAFFLCLRIFMSFIGERLVNVFPYFWRDIANETGDGFTHVRAWQIVLDTVLYIAITIAPFVIFAFVVVTVDAENAPYPSLATNAAAEFAEAYAIPPDRAVAADHLANCPATPPEPDTGEGTS